MLKIWTKLNNIEKFVVITVVVLLTIIGFATNASVIVLFILVIVVSRAIRLIVEDFNERGKERDKELKTISQSCDLNSERPYVISSSGDSAMLKDDYIFINKGKRSRIANCIANNTWEAIDAVDLKIPLDVITVINHKESGLYKGYLEFIYHGFNVRARDIIKHLQENIVTFNTKEESENFLAFKEIVENRIKELKKQNIKGNLSTADELEKLVKLRDRGILTEEEFLLQKKRLMGL